MRAPRLRLAILPPVPEYGDVGPFSASITLHDYLYCWECGSNLYQGITAAGAPIFACRVCQLVADKRRIA